MGMSLDPRGSHETDPFEEDEAMGRKKGKGFEVRRGGFGPGLTEFLELEELRIAGWCPDEKAEKPMEQVHLIFRLKGMEDVSLVCRFKGPDTLAVVIEELIRFRRAVWPEGEALDVDLNELR